MTDVNPASQGTSSIVELVEDPKQHQMPDFENMVTPVKQPCLSSGNGVHNYPDIATLGNVQANLATNFEAEQTKPGCDDKKSSPLLLIGSIPGSTPINYFSSLSIADIALNSRYC